ncbi:MAG: hypothetical protein RLZZ253_3041 [Verrucomicrobiota bacterium]
MSFALSTRVFLVAFWLQGSLALCESILIRPANGVLRTYAWSDVPLFLAALGMAAAMVFSPRLPKRLLLPAVLYTLWQVPGAVPLPVFFSDRTAAFCVAAGECLLGTFLLFWARHWSDGQWASGLDQRPKFSWLHLIRSLLCAVLLLAGFGLLNLQSAVLWIDRKTNGYVRIQRQGIVIEERHFTRDNQEVRLIGMVHIAQPSFYDSVAALLPEKQPAVMLMEGVTDSKNLLAGSFSYSKLASLLGLAAQSESDLHRPQSAAHRVGPQRGLSRKGQHHIEYRQADVDVSELEPFTLTFIRNLGKLLSSNSLLELLQALQGPELKNMTPDDTRSIMADLLQKRNAHVMKQVDAELSSGRMILIPWGAAHLAELQSAILQRGFRESARIPRLAIPFARQEPESAGERPTVAPADQNPDKAGAR